MALYMFLRLHQPSVLSWCHFQQLNASDGTKISVHEANSILHDITTHIYGMRWGKDRNEEEEPKDREMPMGSRGSIRSSSEQPHADGGKLAMSAPSVHPHTNILQRSHTKSCFQLTRHIACGEKREGNEKKYRCGWLQAIKRELHCSWFKKEVQTELYEYDGFFRSHAVVFGRNQILLGKTKTSDMFWKASSYERPNHL